MELWSDSCINRARIDHLQNMLKRLLESVRKDLNAMRSFRISFEQIISKNKFSCRQNPNRIVPWIRMAKGLSLALRIQVIYLAVFATLHSIFASLSFKPLVWCFFGKSMDASYLPAYSLFAIITSIPLALLILLFPGRKLYGIRSPWRWIMIAGQVLAICANHQSIHR